MPRTLTTFLMLVWTASCLGQTEMLNEYVDIQHKRLGFHGVVLITKNNRELYSANIGKASIT